MKPEWGVKRNCRKCAAYFYDLQKTTFECPKCNAKYSQDDFQVKMIKSESNKAKKKTEKVILEESLESLEDNLDQSIDDDLLEDADELSDENVPDVITHEDDE